MDSRRHRLSGAHFIDEENGYVRLRDTDAISDLAASAVGMAVFGDDVLGELSLSIVDIIDRFLPAPKRYADESLPMQQRLARPRFALLTRAGNDKDIMTKMSRGEQIDIATSLPKRLGRYAADRGFVAERPLIRNGSIESYVAKGDVEAAFDIVETGDSARDAGLTVVDMGENIALNVVSRLCLAPSALTAQLIAVDDLVQDRWQNPTSSLTSRMLSDENGRVKKLGEEFGELIRAITAQSPEQVIEEGADVVQWLRVAAVACGKNFTDILQTDVARNDQPQVDILTLTSGPVKGVQSVVY